MATNLPAWSSSPAGRLDASPGRWFPDLEAIPMRVNGPYYIRLCTALPPVVACQYALTTLIFPTGEKERNSSTSSTAFVFLHFAFDFLCDLIIHHLCPSWWGAACLFNNLYHQFHVSFSFSNLTAG